jgi:polyisoprenyl-phosphate glycosyltransferase
MKISAVVPVRDNASTIAELFRRLSAALAKAAGSDYEIVFVNDGSSDRSWAALEALAWTDGRVTAIDLLRDFGRDSALACGFARARGEVVVTLDADLRYPPEEIPALLAAIAERALDVAYGAPMDRASAWRDPSGAALDLARRKAFGTRAHVSPFRAMRGEIAAALASQDRRVQPIDGEIAWLTSRVGDVPVARAPAAPGGRVRAALRSSAEAVDVATTYSLLPLKIAAAIGALFSLVGLIGATCVVAKKLLFGIPVTGYASLIVSIAILSGAQLLTASLIGAYVARIHTNASGRPRYAIRTVTHAEAEARPTAAPEEGAPR